MTAEIVVMNKVGVALASDSASTLRGPRGLKISNTAEKLFRLCEKIPVAVMIYGSSEFMGIPWETILRLFKKHHGNDPLPTLKEYGARLVAFIQSQSALFPAEERFRYVQRIVEGRMDEIVGRILDDLREAPKKAGEEYAITLARRYIAAFSRRLRQTEDLANLPADFRKQISDAYLKKIKQRIKKRFSRPSLPPETVDRFAKSLVSLFSKKRFYDVSGVVVSGYGEDEIFPSLIAYEFEGLLVDGFVKHYTRSDASITFKHRAEIVPFAQTDMVKTFLEGMHPTMRGFLTSYLVEVLGDYGNVVMQLPELRKSRQKSARKHALSKAAEEILNRCFQSINAHSIGEHIQPVVSALASLPKEDLASMAETLVNLTSFKRKVSPDAETVGGPIDVAVISKADGMVWIKKKRYFTRELNQD